MWNLALDVLIPHALPLSKRKGAERLRHLEKRMIFLRDRISMSVEDLSFDKQEAAALKWAIETIVNYETKMAEVKKTD